MSGLGQRIAEAQKISAYLQMYGLFLCPGHPGGKVRCMWLYNDLVQSVPEVHDRPTVQLLQFLRSNKTAD